MVKGCRLVTLRLYREEIETLSSKPRFISRIYPAYGLVISDFV